MEKLCIIGGGRNTGKTELIKAMQKKGIEILDLSQVPDVKLKQFRNMKPIDMTRSNYNPETGMTVAEELDRFLNGFETKRDEILRRLNLL